MDLSYEAIQAGAKEVVVCHRGGCVPRECLLLLARQADENPV